MQQEKKRALSVLETSQALGMGLRSTYKAVRNGDLPAVRVGKRWLVPVAGIERLLNGGNTANGPKQL